MLPNEEDKLSSFFRVVWMWKCIFVEILGDIFAVTGLEKVKNYCI